MSVSKILMILSLALTSTAMACAGGQSEDKMASEKMAGPGAMMAMESTMEKPVFDLTGLGPNVVAYSTEASALTLAANNTVVYFFAASWCPTCRGTFADIKANVAAIPGNFKIVMVNYDTAQTLKSRYGVTYQHTFVHVDSTGKALYTWSGSPTLMDIVAKAKGM